MMRRAMNRGSSPAPVSYTHLASAGEGLRLAVHFNGSGIDLVHAGERLDHRRFAGAVLSHKSVNLTGE